MSIDKKAIINGKLYINETFKKGTILIENDKITDVILEEKTVDLSDYKIIDATNSIVSYGFIDPHVHLRTPGATHKEDWQTGTQAAVNGGFTFIMDMPNTSPIAVDYETLKVKNEYAKKGKVHYGFHIGLTASNVDTLEETVKKCNDDGIPVFGIKVFLGSTTGSMMVESKELIKKALNTSLINLYHAEDEKYMKQFSDIKYTNIDDHLAKRPGEAEKISIEKIGEAAKEIKDKAKIYICHLSSKPGLDAALKLQKDGYNVITEVTPHHLYFDVDSTDKSSFYKVNPPIRKPEDVEYLRKAFNDDTFDVIGTDHAPHLVKEKQSSTPPSGMPGLESAFYALSNLSKQGNFPLEKVFKYMTSAYSIFDIKNRGELKAGNFADIVIIKKENTVFKAENTATKADFSPYDGMETDYKIDKVLVDGKVV